MGVAKGSAPREAGSFWTYRRSPWSGRRDYCACRAAPSSAGFIQLGVVTDPSYERPAIRMASGAALAGSRGTGLTLAERAGVMEIDLPQGVRVRVDGGVDELALRRVLSAVRGLR